MTPTTALRRRAAALLPLLLLPLVAGCDDEDTTGAEATVVVMTRNLYLGGDLFTLLDPACAAVIPVCVDALYSGSVVTSDIPGRMAAIADEIEANDPDLVGLQEVSWYRRQIPSDYVLGDTTANATETTFDFLEILLDALEARGLAYEVVAQNDNADVEFPATADGGASFYDIRLTDRDVILAREGLDTSVLVEANFAVNAAIPIGSTVVEFTRGYSAVNVTKDGVDFTFGNTHLEVAEGEATVVQRVQAQFIASSAGLGDEDPLILVGDFNADPEAEPAGEEEDGYDILVAQFEDAWAELNSTEAGPTCCFAANLNPADDSTLEDRIDLVLFQGDVTPITIGRVGEEAGDVTATTGLWPSDHAGVVATLTVRN
jgi:endonuclease/exonuclease/phosphatase family metal-dependent hydrolase